MKARGPDRQEHEGEAQAPSRATRSQRLGDRRVINDIEATVKFLQNHRAVDGKRIGIIGLCMGGRVVYLAAATNAAFKAAVTYYPGNTGRPWGRDIPSPFERTADIHCPLQGHIGDDDKNPSPEDRQKLAAELTKHNKTYEFYT